MCHREFFLRMWCPYIFRLVALASHIWSLHLWEASHVYISMHCHCVYYTNNQPMETIFCDPINLTSPKLRCMLLKLRTYSLKVKYVGANRILMADTLSRLLIPITDPAIPNLDITISQGHDSSSSHTSWGTPSGSKSSSHIVPALRLSC